MAGDGHREGRNQQIPVDERKKSDKGRQVEKEEEEDGGCGACEHLQAPGA